MKSRFLFPLCTALVVAAAIGSWWLLKANDRNEQSLNPPSANSQARETRKSDSRHVSELISNRVVDPKFITPLGPKGFSIVRSGPLRPNGDALKYVKSLIPASEEGDATATFKIFLATLDCKRIYSNRVANISPDDDDSRRLSECEDLLTDMSTADADWLTKAASQGSVEAMIMYSLNPDYTLPGGRQQYLKDPEAVQRWREQSRTYLEKAVSLGSQDAMLSLSTAYGAGIFVDENPAGQLAYALAAQKVAPIPGFQEAYEPLINSLNSTQRQQAEVWANNIYQQCCKD